jgi:hypothetical protein
MREDRRHTSADTTDREKRTREPTSACSSPVDVATILLIHTSMVADRGLRWVDYQRGAVVRFFFAFFLVFFAFVLLAKTTFTEIMLVATLIRVILSIRQNLMPARDRIWHGDCISALGYSVGASGMVHMIDVSKRMFNIGTQRVKKAKPSGSVEEKRRLYGTVIPSEL